jgi:methyl-accepting chemotaxis protein
VLWYAHPDGTYWTVDGGLQSGSLADRPYFKRVLAGSTVIGELVVSRSTNRPVAVVAVPVTGAKGVVDGVLGASIYLQPLSELLAREMNAGPEFIFWAIDGNGIIAIHSDASNIFTDPSAMSPELKNVTAEMLANESGTATYTFRGHKRTVIYRRSVLTNWHFGFGVLR